MRFRFLVPLTSLIGALVVTVAAEQAKPAAPPAQAAGQTIALFDGKSLSGWRGYKKPDASGSRWTVQDRTLTLPADDGKDTRGGPGHHLGRDLRPVRLVLGMEDRRGR